MLVPAGVGNAEKQSNPVRAKKMRFTATAYAVDGVTASGELTKAGRTIAADPAILPLGSRVLVTGAGRYSGQYVVADTGFKVQGRRLDIFIPNHKVARRFGVKRVHVQVLSRGEPPRQMAMLH
jgi:3D (Asp-Asp-Asp) domain-containing protein